MIVNINADVLKQATCEASDMLWSTLSVFLMFSTILFNIEP